jgi:hypothetical protein
VRAIERTQTNAHARLLIPDLITSNCTKPELTRRVVFGTADFTRSVRERVPGSDELDDFDRNLKEVVQQLLQRSAPRGCGSSSPARKLNASSGKGRRLR